MYGYLKILAGLGWEGQVAMVHGQAAAATHVAAFCHLPMPRLEQELLLQSQKALPLSVSTQASRLAHSSRTSTTSCCYWCSLTPASAKAIALAADPDALNARAQA